MVENGESAKSKAFSFERGGEIVNDEELASALNEFYVHVNADIPTLDINSLPQFLRIFLLQNLSVNLERIPYHSDPKRTTTLKRRSYQTNVLDFLSFQSENVITWMIENGKDRPSPI